MLLNSPPIVGEGQGVGSVIRKEVDFLVDYKGLKEVTDPTPNPSP